MPSPSIDTLVVVSHVVHYRHDGALFAYGPYAREIDIWADLFPQLVIAAPCRDAAPTGDCLAFTRRNISIEPQVDVGGDTLTQKLNVIVSLPALMARLAGTLSRADAVHVRCPGTLGLAGVLLAPVFCRRVVAKYAGQWNGFDGETLPGRLERFLLRSWWWPGPVTVYGEWPGHAAHVVPFFTSMMTTEQVRRAVAVAAAKRLGTPLRVLYAGMLEPRKRVDALIDAVKMVMDQGTAVELAIVGDGAERRSLEARVDAHDMRHATRFAGALPFNDALAWYDWAHCLVLPSQHSEGWPKVVAEAMSHGVVCVAVDHGQVGRMLRDRGALLAHGSAEEIAAALLAISSDADAYRADSQRACAWARQYSLEGLQRSLADLLASWWRCPVGVPPVETSAAAGARASSATV
jgi:glycosyltransferase involved in cell wall biosynthesis